MKNIFKKLQVILEYLLLVILLNILNFFSFDKTSFIGGFLIGNFGRFSRYKKIISCNLKVLKLSENKIEEITNQNLVHMGRVFFEFFSLNKFEWKNITSKNSLYLNEINSFKGSKIFISAHIGNWEITRNYLLNQGFILHSVYRQANNYKIDHFIQKKRKRSNAFFYKKGSQSAKNMIKALKNKGDLALLLDQRDSSGPLINFLGKQAYATDGFASLALKYQTMICPVFTIRNIDNTFQFIYEKPLIYEDYKENDPFSLTQKIYKDYFEKWIKTYPDQWLWAHERWKL